MGGQSERDEIVGSGTFREDADDEEPGLGPGLGGLGTVPDVEGVGDE